MRLVRVDVLDVDVDVDVDIFFWYARAAVRSAVYSCCIFARAAAFSASVSVFDASTFARQVATPRGGGDAMGRGRGCGIRRELI